MTFQGNDVAVTDYHQRSRGNLALGDAVDQLDVRQANLLYDLLALTARTTFQTQKIECLTERNLDG